MLFEFLNVKKGSGVNCDMNIHTTHSEVCLNPKCVLPGGPLINLCSSPQVTVIYNQVVFEKGFLCVALADLQLLL